MRKPCQAKRSRCATACTPSVVSSDRCVLPELSSPFSWPRIGQQAAQAAAPPRSHRRSRRLFRAEANLVRVDVTVVDRHGEPMAALTADDFAVEEDGVPQTVQSFQFVVANGRRTDGDGDSLAIRSPEHAAAEAARDDVRVFVIFWDDYHIDRFANAIQRPQGAHRFPDASSFGPTDLVALMDPLTPMDALRFTRDRSELGLKIKKLEGRLGVYHAAARRARRSATRSRRRAPAIRGHVVGAEVGGGAPRQPEGRAQVDRLRERGAARPRAGTARATCEEMTDSPRTTTTSPSTPSIRRG